jgi:hypothetical protein
MSSKADCLNCAIRGYSPELCGLHLRMATCDGQGDDACACPAKSPNGEKSNKSKLTKTLAAGACVGVLTSAVGIGAAVAVGVKGVLEAVIAAKLMAGMGMAGAVTSAAIKNKKGPQDAKDAKHAGYSVPVLYVKEG